MSDTPTVFKAWSAVMHEVQSIEKNEYNKAQGFKFRGIDSVMDVVGPALRKHGVVVVPSVGDHNVTQYETRGKDGNPGTMMVNRVVRTTFTVYGPTGDSFTGVTYGESADAGDKAVAKAQSVALRTFLLQALMVPTGDPDPDTYSHERAASRSAPPPAKTDADVARDALLREATGLGWQPAKLAQRFYNDYGVDIRTAEAPVIRGFTAAIISEAEAQDTEDTT